MNSDARRRRGPEFVTRIACTACRKKRAKCDGRNPCARCASQNTSTCSYEVPTKFTKEEMRSEIEQLQDHQAHSRRILEALASSYQSANILQQLRSGGEMEDIVRGLEQSASVSTSDNASSNNSQDMSSTPSAYRSTSTTTNDSSVYGSIQDIIGDEVTSYDPLGHHNAQESKEPWTTVTSDRALIEHLLALYFCWEYPIFATISKEHFMHDFRRRSTRYCSTLLVNALLALACRYSDMPGTCSFNDRATAGDVFFTEAQELLRTVTDRHTLTTVQALGIMSIREASCGRVNESSFLSSQSVSLAIEMGLHLDISQDTENNMDNAVRATTFWGALSLNELQSLSTGSLPHLSQHIQLPAKPALVQHVEDAMWTPYTDDGIQLDKHFDQTSNLRSVYHTFCDLAEKVHIALYSLHSPSSRVDSKALVFLYNQYTQWYATMPESLRLGGNFTPAVLFLHLFYHSALLLLFQPYISLRLTNSPVLPQEVCYQAADAISSIVKSYSNLYTLRRTPSFVPYFVFVSSVIHLIAVKNEPTNVEHRQRLVQGTLDLEEMAGWHGFALRALGTIRYLATCWNNSTTPSTKSGQPLEDPWESASGSSDSISADSSILEVLRSVQPILSPNGLYYTPSKNLSQDVSSSQLEEGGFTIASKD